MTLHNFQECETALAKFVPPARKFRAAYALDNMRKLMNLLGNPQDQYKVVHVAGTSGKTSTAYYTAALLRKCGKQVGLTVSPHVDELNERVQINGKPLPETDYCKELTQFLEIINKLSISPTYFEVLVAFAFWEFARQKVDYAVVEVGLGGLLDGTNVITRADKVCVLTDIGLDHTNVLGKTLPEIAAQKAGILHQGNMAICYRQPKAVMRVFRAAAKEKGVKLLEIEPEDHLATRSLPLFQRRNWQLANGAVNMIAERDGLSKLSDAQLRQTAEIHIPARMELVQAGGRTWILDGAHNEQKVKALVGSVTAQFKNQPIAVMIALLQGKREKMLKVMKTLLPISSHLIITSFDTQQDLRKHSVASETVMEVCKELGFDSAEIVDSPEKALKTLEARDEKIYLVTGSLYLLNHIRPDIIKR